MTRDKCEYTVVKKGSGNVLDTFWAEPGTQHLKAKEKYDLRKVNIVKIYPKES